MNEQSNVFPDSDFPYRSIFYNNPISMALLTPDGVSFIEVNERFLRLVNFTRQELLGGAVPPPQLWAVPAAYTWFIDALRTNSSVQYVPATLKTGTGQHVNVRLTATLIAAGGLPCILVVFMHTGRREPLAQGTGQALADSMPVPDSISTVHAQQLQKLATAAVLINSALSLKAMLDTITYQAREIVGAHQATTSLIDNEGWAQAVNAVSLSDKYADWRDYSEQRDGSGIYRLICTYNLPMRMTQAELEMHPAWRNFGHVSHKHPPLRGWLAVPLMKRNGDNIGLIQLSDKYEGEFTESDEAILIQLGQMAAVAIENARLVERSQIDREQMQHLTRQLLTVQEQERRRLARELHDELGQGLLVLKLDLQLIKDSLPAELTTLGARLDESVALADDVTNQMRTLSMELRPSLLDDLGLIPTLDWFTERFAQRTGIQVDFTVSAMETRLPGDIETAIFRSVQEALTNVARYAQATLVQIHLEKRDHSLVVIISDNGIGFEVVHANEPHTLVAQGTGLSGMRERLYLIGGSLVVHSVPGQGTTLQIEVPGV